MWRSAVSSVPLDSAGDAPHAEEPPPPPPPPPPPTARLEALLGCLAASSPEPPTRRRAVIANARPPTAADDALALGGLRQGKKCGTVDLRAEPVEPAALCPSDGALAAAAATSRPQQQPFQMLPSCLCGALDDLPCIGPPAAAASAATIEGGGWPVGATLPVETPPRRALAPPAYATVTARQRVALTNYRPTATQPSF